MGSNEFLMTLIIIGSVILVLMIYPKPLKILLRIIIQALGGIAGLYIFNFVLSPLGWFVGINWTTILIIGILGIPGLIFLYLLNLIL
ncbi:MAG TPA: pro-sigmaK processing inhibitor BofA family protein [Defluviitaleaceae bacterium]|jgi:inhibitor of the pro-sigma K processing machinery|nr:sigmaK-factor processing regulatory BofA [Candidatus Epulonipiscium sp.]HOQ15895.1 pro-sigmaK processing inhibitor BofA family protein [Defluviitaleaceae bacterium]HPT75891.1 pro-sigmaK processing inhibitor BofA family protein [Defluviitaleaceae bacterium]HQD50705.1 pro-sigmaK processing inhibitor BofA family protein [Defluviitaleaceae bacterium]